MSFLLRCAPLQVPVFRELYSEKAVVTEERRLRVDNAPLGRWQEEFAAASLINSYRCTCSCPWPALALAAPANCQLPGGSLAHAAAAA